MDNLAKVIARLAATPKAWDLSLLCVLTVMRLITFRVSRRPREMYCGHARLCVCLSAAACLHYCTDPADGARRADKHHQTLSWKKHHGKQHRRRVTKKTSRKASRKPGGVQRHGKASRKTILAERHGIVVTECIRESISDHRM